MSQAADEVTANPRFQNLSVTLDADETSNMMLPHATIAAGSGQAFSVLRGPGTTGVFILANDSLGGSIATKGSVASIETDALEWLLLRIQ
jgi:hypothetical protein